MHKLKPIYLIIFMLLFQTNMYAQNKTPFVIPSLREWQGAQGNFQLGKNINFIAKNQSEMALLNAYLQTFANDLKIIAPKTNIEIKVGTPQKGDFYFEVDSSNQNIKPEGYELNIGETVTIKANKPIGAFWATRTIIQILSQGDKNLIPKGVAKDYPKWQVRSFILDDGRKFFTIDFLRDYVKLMAYYKFNDFQIHLNDNGFKKFFGDDWNKTYSAFRLENDTYPNLTAKDGSYSKAQFIELQKMANTYGVTIVPEIDVPAHALSISKAVPEIASAKYGHDHLDLSNPKTYEVVQNIFKEYLEGPNPVFINKEVHIGTDEYAKEEAENFRKFTDSTIKYVESFGKQVRMWGALTHAQGNTPVKVKNVTMNLWYNGYADPKEMFKLGYKGISTPDGWLYLVPAAGYYYDYLNLANLYQKWTPAVIGNEIFDENFAQIRGGAFAVWNDHVGNGISEKDVTDRAFPAFQVLAQKMWLGDTAKKIIAFTDFEKQKHLIGEAPGINLRGKVTGKDSLVLFYKKLDKTIIKDKSGNHRNATKQNEIITPLEEIGYSYTVSFDINPVQNNTDDCILFSSKNALVKLKQGETGKLGFSRDGYNYYFDYVVPEKIWTNLTITGNNKGTSLYINGILKQRLQGEMQTFANTKDKIAKIETLVFPLKKINTSTFRGAIKNLKVYNKILAPETISKKFSK